ncbi:MAG: hypothetical protein JWL86_46 [Rhizobium sp.]|nr:hypothetical protein [Rhizobium sp.]
MHERHAMIGVTSLLLACAAAGVGLTSGPGERRRPGANPKMLKRNTLRRKAKSESLSNLLRAAKRRA